MKLRLMLPDDYDNIMVLWQHSDGIGINPDDTKPYITNYLKRNPKTSFIAIDNNQIIGAILAGHDGYRGSIRHTAVHPSYRHQGIGTQLVQSAVNALLEEGIHKITLVVFQSNIPGNAFWEAQGFSIRNDLFYRDLRMQ